MCEMEIVGAAYWQVECRSEQDCSMPCYAPPWWSVKYKLSYFPHTGEVLRREAVSKQSNFNMCKHWSSVNDTIEM